MVLPLAILALAIAASILAVRRKKYVFIFGIFWFILSLLHLLKSMYKFNVDAAMEEHWVYFASIGFFVIAANFILRFKKFKIPAAVAVISIYTVLTFVNSLHWKESLGFYRYNLKLVRKSMSFLPRFNYAMALKEKGLFKEALAETGTLLRIAPERFGIYILEGDIYEEMGKNNEAENAYRQALRLERFCWQANIRLKDLAAKTGRPYQEEIEPWLSPQEAKVVSEIMNGEFYNAIMDADHALESFPTPLLYTLKGIIFCKTGHYDAAMDAYNDALKLDPGNKIALHNLAVLYYNMNKIDKAEEIRKKLE